MRQLRHLVLLLLAAPVVAQEVRSTHKWTIDRCDALIELIQKDIDSYCQKLVDTKRSTNIRLANRLAEAKDIANQSTKDLDVRPWEAVDVWNGFLKEMTLPVHSDTEVLSLIAAIEQAAKEQRARIAKNTVPVEKEDPTIEADVTAFLDRVKAADKAIRGHWQRVARRGLTERRHASDKIVRIMQKLNEAGVPERGKDYWTCWWDGMEKMREALTIRDTDSRSIGLTRIAVRSLKKADKERKELLAWCREKAEAEAKAKAKKAYAEKKADADRKDEVKPPGKT